MKEEKKSCIFINISEKKKNIFKQEKYKHMYIFIH